MRVALLVGPLSMALGTASILTGWTWPWARRKVKKPRIYGLGALMVGTACLVQGLLHFRTTPTGPWQMRFLNALVICGLAVLAAGQGSSLRRRKS
ncbi:hypothetical protein OHT93_38610 [Streptomyces sp. NBC_00191]|uniref:hypothetical protein n=1 Tax=Streptomyces sp. NBC_00191 TaxID=2975674 RepID=UPI00324E5581